MTTDADKPDVAKLVESVKSLRAARHEWEGASSTELLLLDAVGEALLALSARLAEKEGDLAAANARADKNEKDAERYRWLRDKIRPIYRQRNGGASIIEWYIDGQTLSKTAVDDINDVDAAIDAAIAAKEKPNG